MGAAINARNLAAMAAGFAAGQGGAAASNTPVASGKPQTQAAALADPAMTPQRIPRKSPKAWPTLRGQKAAIDVTNTAPNRKLLGAYTSLIKLSEELQTHLRRQNELSASKDPTEEVAKKWRATCRKARDDILELAASAKTGGSTNVPMAFGTVQIPPSDQSAQTAQLNTAMQGVQIAQSALDNAENAYNAAVEKQERMAKAMATIQARLKKLQTTGKTLEEIKTVLQDCIQVLADLMVQITRLERFFIALTTLIDVLVMPRAKLFERDVGKIGRRGMLAGVLRVEDVDKQAIYASTLQLKAYFSLLEDIATMYTIVHREHIVGGVELCYELSKGVTRNDGMPEQQEKLTKYTENASALVAALVADKQREILRTLRARDETAQIEAEMARFKIAPVDDAAKLAIENGAREQQAVAQELLASEPSVTVAAVRVAEESEGVDANEL
ncbi:hypothetical protein CHGG_09941 [Chaetomium globosum CBS 148.51]|uniref:Uncharacterized protein n=1 Tax=Chaetomium globosum (strain ATCC 6205 / CBS 148.51 / DSM 1962 / NBRC 6347 / NRRL 1970) TaxID=306901 RepID=Q2GQ13_CHAGB|nr:uncharacterized protein CHGG_09941 [Chaetomium globosum CBS 148.51]EAQ83537.1 hypothetical protein CHGG_09941 [Chaetomium globosum CBS 148.51]